MHIRSGQRPLVGFSAQNPLITDLYYELSLIISIKLSQLPLWFTISFFDIRGTISFVHTEIRVTISEIQKDGSLAEFIESPLSGLILFFFFF